MNALSHDEIERLTHALVDGVIGADEHERLGEALRVSEENRLCYIKVMEMHNLLEHEAAEASVAAPAQLIPVELLLRRQRRQSVRRAVLAAVAVLMVGVVFLHRVLVPDVDPTVAVKRSPDAVLHLTHSKVAEGEMSGDVMEPGSSLHLTAGAVELSFGSGVRSLVQAPAVVRLIDDDRLGMEEGVAWFHVPHSAVGFQVVTEELTATDLGTEFGVLATPGGPDEVHVFTGRVEVVGKPEGSRSSVLGAPMASRVAGDGSQDGIEPRPDLFRTTLDTAPLRYLHWSFNEGDPGSQSVGGDHPDRPAIKSHCVGAGDGDPFADFSSVPGRFGNALSSFGRGERVETNWTGMPSGEDFTVAFWIKVPPGHQATRNLVGWNASEAGDSTFLVSVENPGEGCVAAVTLGDTVYHGTTRLDDGDWHHIAIVAKESSTTHAAGKDAFSWFVDGRPETTAGMESSAASDGFGVAGRGHWKTSSTLTMLEGVPVREELNKDVSLALVRDHGTTHVFLNGTRVGFGSGSPLGGDELTTLMIGANVHTSGRIEGFFTGSIDRVRLSTFSGSLGSSGLLGAEKSKVTLVADYTFDDNRIPSEFVVIGDPEVIDGRLVLDGDDALRLEPTPLAATDNFMMEARLSMSRYPSGLENFAFPLSNGNGSNLGWGLLFKDTWGGVIMGLQAVGSASTSSGGDISVAMDELYVFETALDQDQVAQLQRDNKAPRMAGFAESPLPLPPDSGTDD